MLFPPCIQGVLAGSEGLAVIKFAPSRSVCGEGQPEEEVYLPRPHEQAFDQGRGGSFTMLY